MQHLQKMFLLFLGAAVVTLGFGLGVSAPGLISGGLTAALVAAGTLAGGVGLTIWLRSRFALIQTGRFLQYGSFWLSSALSFKLVALVFGLFGVTIALSSTALASFVTFALCFAVATAIREVPIKGRTWMPVRLKKK